MSVPATCRTRSFRQYGGIATLPGVSRHSVAPAPAPSPCPQDAQQLAALRSMGVAGAVAHLLQTTSGLGRLLHAAPVLVGLAAAGQGC